MFLQSIMFLVAATMLHKCSCNTPTVIYNTTIISAITLPPSPATTLQAPPTTTLQAPPPSPPAPIPASTSSPSLAAQKMKHWLDDNKPISTPKPSLAAQKLQNWLDDDAPSSALQLPPAATSPASPRECGSMDIRNDCVNLWLLKDCQSINGYLMIVLLPSLGSSLNCDFEQYKFPLLREITDFFILFDVKGLRFIRDLFPNLTVIRGRRLFLNYALGITNMPHLEAVEFKSLVAIQRGHVFIGTCPKLCNLEKINWDRLTLAPGENHIFPVEPESCPTPSECIGCETGYCWSNTVCQKFDNDNVVNLKQGSHYCHEECLGGCNNNNTNKDCVVCKRLTDHGACVKECPEDKFLLEHHERCYTKDECTNELGMYANDGTCDLNCPKGFIPDDAYSDLDNCVPCQPLKQNEPITIFSLADADHIRGCEILNGSLVISIRNKVYEPDLVRSLSSLREIRGHLKVYRSPHLTSLKFLRNLTIVSGEPLENKVYAFIIYDNKNLRELWDPEKFELKRGSMYVHLNNKLCNHKLKDFQEKVMHDRNADSLQIADQEVLCGPAKLLLEIQVMSHRSLKLSWRIQQTSEEIEILYRPIQNGTVFSEHSELDSDVCTRINWQRRLVFRSELRNNGTHYAYTVDDLKQHTKYACLVKTFGENYKNDARSELKFVTTQPDIPTAPLIKIIKKTETSLTLQLQQQNLSNEIVNYYELELYELPDDIQLLDKRNYCHCAPDWYLLHRNINQDYEKCCERLEEEAEDNLFKQNMRDQFSCSLDKKQNCLPATHSESDSKLLSTFRLKRNETKHTLHHLERYRLYALQVKACNEVGCGSFGMHHERTDHSNVTDKIDDLRACRLPIGSGEFNEYHLYFTEPKHPNGAILSYTIHYRVDMPAENAYRYHVNCVTRLQHAQAKFEYVTQLNDTFSQIAVRIRSLAGYMLMPDYINVTPCLTTKIAGNSHGLNIFLVCFFIGAGCTLLWVGYKRRYWRKIHEMRRYLPLHRSWRTLVARPTPSEDDDRQILVEGFESVRFHNDPDDAKKYLE